jgi:4-amino-4-deoxy-L-arabinose transferase-like glycosyltransferase
MAVGGHSSCRLFSAVPPACRTVTTIIRYTTVSFVAGLTVLVLQAGACTGMGAALLKLVGLRAALPWPERLAWSFALGFGCLGWIMFLLGVMNLFDEAHLAITLAVGCAGLFYIGKLERQDHMAPQGLRPTEWLLIAGIIIIAFGDAMEAIAPPTDADSLAYHFELPRRFLEAGGLFFVPRAVDGGVPLLIQLTYVPALALGGEYAMTMWTGFSGWAVCGLLYVICRRYLDRPWALAAALLFASTPTVIYAAGSGQVEVRMALFVMVAAFSAAVAVHQQDVRWALLAGLAAGFAAGSKYTGLLLVPAVGLVCLMGKGWFRRGMAYTAGVLIAGCQWYVWNAVNSGDPLFPLLYPLIDYPQSGIWDAIHDAALRQKFFGVETPLPRSIWNFFAYPFIATLHGSPVMESGRTGLGPWGLLVLPLVLFSFWKFRHRLITHPLLPVTICLLILYILWFFTGSSQRVRHLLPAYPLFLIVMLVAAHRWSVSADTKGLLAATCLVTCGVQVPIQALFTQSFVRYAVSGDSREAFFARSVPGYAAIPWINANLLPQQNRLALFQRQLLYVINLPTYFTHPLFQSLVDVRDDSQDPAKFARELTAQRISHVLDVSDMDSTSSQPDFGHSYLLSALEEAGCIAEIYRTSGAVHASRTLPEMGHAIQTQRVLELRLGDCPIGQ